MPPDSVARALKVGTLVQGTLTQAGERFRVSVLLINASSGSEIASKTLERPHSVFLSCRTISPRRYQYSCASDSARRSNSRKSRVGARNPKAWDLCSKPAR